MKSCERVKKKKTLNIKVWNDAAKAFIPFKCSAHVICGMNAKILNAPILNNHVCINGELQHFLPNDTGSSAPWLHRVLLFVTVQHIFQSHVSRRRSGSVSEKRVSLIGRSPEKQYLNVSTGRRRPGRLMENTFAADLCFSGMWGQEMTSW